MRRWTIVLFALVASALVVSAIPVASIQSGDTLVVGSQHTTDGDFQNAQELTNVSVQGTGDGADVVYNPAPIYDDYEDGDLSEYGGDSGYFAAQSSIVLEGSTTLQGSVSDGSIGGLYSTTGLGQYPSAGDSFNVSWRYANAGANQYRLVYGAQSETTGLAKGYHVIINSETNRVELERRGTSNQQLDYAGISAGAHDGTELTLNVQWKSDGNHHVTLYDSSGAVLATLSGYDTTYTSGGIGAALVDNGGNPTMYVDNWHATGDTSDSGTYGSATHTVEGAESAAVDLTLQNALADVTVRDASDGTVYATAQYSTSGNKSLSFTPSGSDIQVVVTFSRDGADAVGTLHDETILYTNHAPDYDNGSATPKNGSLANEDPVTLSLDVSDQNFEGNGDTVEVDFYVDGDKKDTKTIVQNETVSTSVSGLSGGDHTWHAVITDSHGATTSTPDYEFDTAATLYIQNETDPGQLVDGGVEVTVKFFGDDETVYERNTTDGSIDLSGLPSGERLVISATAENYYDRQIILDSLVEQHTVYLLPTNATSVETRFTLNDQTGKYSREGTRLYIKKPITEDGATNYQVIAADKFGQNGYTVTLEEGARYRLTIKNDDGDSRDYGKFSADVSETIPIELTEIEYDVTDDYDGYQWSFNATGDEGDKTLNFAFKDYAEDSDNITQTEDLQVVIYERDNRENNTIYEKTFYDTVTSAKYTEELTAAQSNKTWVVEWTATRDGETITGKRIAGPGKRDVIGDLDRIWKSIAAVGLLVIIGVLFSQANAGVGAIVVSIIGGMLWYIGFLPADVGGGAVALALFVSVVFKAGGSR